MLLLLFIGNIFVYASSMCLTLLRRTPHCFSQLVNLLVTFVAFVFFALCVFNGVYTWGKIFPTHVLRSIMFGLHPGHVLCLGVFFAFLFLGVSCPFGATLSLFNLVALCGFIDVSVRGKIFLARAMRLFTVGIRPVHVLYMRIFFAFFLVGFLCPNSAFLVSFRHSWLAPSNMSSKSKPTGYDDYTSMFPTLTSSSSTSKDTFASAAGPFVSPTMANTQFNIPVFDGNKDALEQFLFQLKATVLLRYKNPALHAFDLARPSLSDLSLELNAQIYCGVASVVKGLAFQVVQDVAFGDGWGAINALRREFGQQTRLHVPAVFMRFLALRWNTDPLLFRFEINKHLKDMASVGINLDVTLLRCLILNKLPSPSHFDPLVEQEMLRDGASVAELMDRLFHHMQFVQQRTLTATVDSPLAAFAMGPAPSGKPRGGGAPPGDSKDAPCSNCHRTGHDAPHCFKLHPELKTEYEAKRAARKAKGKEKARGKNKGGAPPAARAHAALSEPSAMSPLEVTFGSVFDNSDDSICACALNNPDIDVCTSVDVPSNLSVCVDPSALSMVFPSPSCHAVCRIRNAFGFWCCGCVFSSSPG